METSVAITTSVALTTRICESGWQEYSCVCRSGFRVQDNQCFNPCNPSPCRNGASCDVLPATSSVTFQCGCTDPFHGPTCEEITGETCSTGFYAPSTSSITSCRRCPCDPEGVREGVCDNSNGECNLQGEMISMLAILSRSRWWYWSSWK